VRAGDRVELRSAAEILATLDDRGCLDGVPFMPEMLAFFGKTFTVTAQANRACDTIRYSGVRRLEQTVLLDDLRCEGAAHAGCQAQCRLYWKEAWLRPASSAETPDDPRAGEAAERLERLVTAGVRGNDSTVDEPTFRCQATELLRASEPVSWYDLHSFAYELTGGNVPLWRWLRAMIRIALEQVARGVGLLRNAPFGPDDLAGQRSYVDPDARELRPGELVQIRSKPEIRATLAQNGKNRGLWFDREMVPYCGQTVRVKAKVERFVDEGTGRLVELSSDCYMLDEVVCQSFCSDKRWFCPRAIHPWWRACWLAPVENEAPERTA